MKGCARYYCRRWIWTIVFDARVKDLLILLYVAGLIHACRKRIIFVHHCYCTCRANSYIILKNFFLLFQVSFEQLSNINSTLPHVSINIPQQVSFKKKKNNWNFTFENESCIRTALKKGVIPSAAPQNRRESARAPFLRCWLLGEYIGGAQPEPKHSELNAFARGGTPQIGAGPR